MMLRVLFLVLLGSSCAGELRFGAADGGSDAGLCGAVACVECAADNECAGGSCDIARGRCRQRCDRDPECPVATFPRECSDDFGAKVCSECHEADECPSSRPICAGGLCVSCDDDAQCPGGQCDRSRGVCISG